MGNAIILHEQSNSLLQCTIRSQGCGFNINGHGCKMCNYGKSTNVTPKELKDALYNEVLPALKGKNKVLFGSFGSILDRSEVSSQCFEVLLDFINELVEVQLVIFETHYSLISENIVKHIRQRLHQTIDFEIGLESKYTSTLSSIGKQIDLDEVLQVVDLVNSYKNMSISCNILLGVPNYNNKPYEQLKDSKSTIQWAIVNGFNSVVIFPINIKEDTQLYRQYQSGKYTPISGWLLFELLRNIDESLLDRVQISWWDERGKEGTIHPITCDKCHDNLMQFYKDYTNNRNSEDRAKLIRYFSKTQINCKCKRSLDRVHALKYIDSLIEEQGLNN